MGQTSNDVTRTIPTNISRGALGNAGGSLIAVEKILTTSYGNRMYGNRRLTGWGATCGDRWIMSGTSGVVVAPAHDHAPLSSPKVFPKAMKTAPEEVARRPGRSTQIGTVVDRIYDARPERVDGVAIRTGDVEQPIKLGDHWSRGTSCGYNTV